MKKIALSLFILILLIIFGSFIMLVNQEKEPKGLIPKFSWQGKKEMSKDLMELKKMVKGLDVPSFWPRSLTIKGNYLYVSDSGNERIQVLEIK